MSVMASQITSLTIVYSTVYYGADQRKHQRWIPRTKASDAENVSIWWRHHEVQQTKSKQEPYTYFTVYTVSIISLAAQTKLYALHHSEFKHFDRLSK